MVTMMKRVWLIVFSILLTLLPAVSQADAGQDYEQAYKIYIAAGISVAAYDDRIGNLARRYLEEEGWEIDRYVQAAGQDGARFLLAKKDLGNGKQTYFLSFVGTENADDVKCNLKVDKVYFAGSSLAELTANASKAGIAANEPKVHQGFFEFAQSGLEAKMMDDTGTARLLSDILSNNKDSKLYLVGHSLGGAAATITGAALLNMGINTDQIEVITFGAPAVGNHAFAAKYEPALKLTRIVIAGDPVTGVLQTLVGGYAQFGKEIKWHMPPTTDRPHNITEYVDLALKHYYDKRRQFRESAGQVDQAASYDNKMIYITPLKNTLPEPLKAEFWYMQEALRDEYMRTIPGCMVAGESDNWREKAKQLGYRWVIVPELQVTQLKQARNTHYITLSQTIYEVSSGAVVQTAVFSTGTYKLTPLEAFVHNLKGINSGQMVWNQNR